MATITKLIQKGWYFWLVEWTGTPPFRIFRDGRQYSRGYANADTMQATVQGDDQYDAPVIEILEDGETSLFAPYQSWATLQWKNVPDAVMYVVQKYIDAEWTTVASPLKNADDPYVRWETPALADDSENQYRILSRDKTGQLSAVETMTFTHHRIPPAPDVNFVYDEGTTTLTVEERV
jgi:hypothetical protein